MRLFKSTINLSNASAWPRKPLMVLRICVLSALLCISSLSFADDAEKTITLDEAYRLALTSNEAIGIAQEGISQADSNVDKAFSQILPRLNAEGSYTVFSEQKLYAGSVIQPDDYARVDVKLTQPIYTGGREYAARRQARIISSRSKAARAAAREAVIRLTARAYYGLLKVERDVEIKVAALKRAEERQKVAVARLKAGEVTRTTVLRSDALLAGAQAELIKAQGDVKNARSLLSRITGISGGFHLAEPPELAASLQDADALIKTALAQRSDYKQSLLDERAADEGISYAKSWFMPSLRLEGTYTWREQHPASYVYPKESVSGAVVISVPIFEGGLRYAELSEARSKRREAELRRFALKRDIEVQVVESINRLESVSASLETYKRQLSFTEDDARMVAEQFKYGLVTIVEVIDSDSALVSAQRSLMTAAYDLELAKIELKAATGRLNEETPVTEAEREMLDSAD